MEAGLREVCRSVRIGKILIQRVRTNRLSILHKEAKLAFRMKRQLSQNSFTLKWACDATENARPDAPLL